LQEAVLGKSNTREQHNVLGGWEEDRVLSLDSEVRNGRK
jgi:hypothetical protein